MRKEELSLGNWVKVDGEPKRIEELSKVGAVLSDGCFAEYDEIEPLELRECKVIALGGELNSTEEDITVGFGGQCTLGPSYVHVVQNLLGGVGADVEVIIPGVSGDEAKKESTGRDQRVTLLLRYNVSLLQHLLVIGREIEEVTLEPSEVPPALAAFMGRFESDAYSILSSLFNMPRPFFAKVCRRAANFFLNSDKDDDSGSDE